MQCGIRLSRELSGEGPEVQRLSARQAAAANPYPGLRARGRRHTRHCCHRVADGGAKCKRLRVRWVAGELGWAPETMPHTMQQQPAMHQPMMGNQGFSQPAFCQPVLGFGQGGALGHGDSFGNQYTPAFCPIGNQNTPAFCPAGLLRCELITRYCALMQQSQQFFCGPGMMPPPNVETSMGIMA